MAPTSIGMRLAGIMVCLVVASTLAAAKQGKACGTQVVEPTPARVKAALRRGYTFVMLASDVFILWKWSEAMGKLIRDVRRR